MPGLRLGLSLSCGVKAPGGPHPRTRLYADDAKTSLTFTDDAQTIPMEVQTNA